MASRQLKVKTAKSCLFDSYISTCKFVETPNQNNIDSQCEINERGRCVMARNLLAPLSAQPVMPIAPKPKATKTRMYQYNVVAVFKNQGEWDQDQKKFGEALEQNAKTFAPQFRIQVLRHQLLTQDFKELYLDILVSAPNKTNLEPWLKQCGKLVRIAQITRFE